MFSVYNVKMKRGWGISFYIATALKIKAGQRSLTVATSFVTAKKLCRTVTMTANI